MRTCIIEYVKIQKKDILSSMSNMVFKNRFPKGGQICRRQAVNPRYQTLQGQSVAKPETPLQNIQVGVAWINVLNVWFNYSSLLNCSNTTVDANAWVDSLVFLCFTYPFCYLNVTLANLSAVMHQICDAISVTTGQWVTKLLKTSS